jgi:hypothetical protein
MDTPMTREELKKKINNIARFLKYPDLGDLHAIDDTDATLRGELAQRDHDIVRLADQVDAAERRANISAAKTERLREELAQVKKQLPVEMQSCTILFKECPKGHGELTATNWVHHECLVCQLAQAKQSRHDIIQDFIHGKDKLCLVCGAKAPCELKDDPSSPCTFDPTPMELLAAYRRQVKQINELEKRAQIADWYESLVTRACIGTSKTPSLKAYIEQLEARVKELEIVKNWLEEQWETQP